MSSSSTAVINWRRRTKERIVQAMGGRCYVCGYDHYIGAMDLHHINPSEKEFSLGGLRSNPIAWVRIVEELKKCILVCSNCHREIEGGVIVLDNPRSTFNEEYTDYTDVRGTIRKTYKEKTCAQCGSEISVHDHRQKYCSDVCRKLYNKKLRS